MIPSLMRMRSAAEVADEPPVPITEVRPVRLPDGSVLLFYQLPVIRVRAKHFAREPYIEITDPGTIQRLVRATVAGHAKALDWLFLQPSGKNGPHETAIAVSVCFEAPDLPFAV